MAAPATTSVLSRRTFADVLKRSIALRANDLPRGTMNSYRLIVNHASIRPEMFFGPIRDGEYFKSPFKSGLALTLACLVALIPFFESGRAEYATLKKSRPPLL